MHRATGPAQPLKRAPGWLKRPVGATFGFGGKLVAFSNSARQLQTGEVVETGQISISQVGIARQGVSMHGLSLCSTVGCAGVNHRERGWQGMALYSRPHLPWLPRDPSM